MCRKLVDAMTGPGAPCQPEPGRGSLRIQKVAERHHSDKPSPGGALGAGLRMLPRSPGWGHPRSTRRAPDVGCWSGALRPLSCPFVVWPGRSRDEVRAHPVPQSFEPGLRWRLDLIHGPLLPAGRGTAAIPGGVRWLLVGVVRCARSSLSCLQLLDAGGSQGDWRRVAAGRIRCGPS